MAQRGVDFDAMGRRMPYYATPRTRMRSAPPGPHDTNATGHHPCFHHWPILATAGAGCAAGHFTVRAVMLRCRAAGCFVSR